MYSLGLIRGSLPIFAFIGCHSGWHTLTISLVAVVEVVETLWCFKCPIKCRFAEFLFLIIHGIVATGSKSASA